MLECTEISGISADYVTVKVGETRNEVKETL